MSPARLRPSPGLPDHTLSVTHPPLADLHPSSHQVVSATLADTPYIFLQPSPGLHTATLLIAKRYLDSLAAYTSHTQEQRLQATRRKRKRGDDIGEQARNILRLKQVHLEGFTLEQIWEQSRRVLGASVRELEESLPDALRHANGKAIARPAANKQNGTNGGIKMVRFDDDGFELSDSDAEDVGGRKHALSEVDEDAIERGSVEEGDMMDEEMVLDGAGIDEDVEADDMDSEKDDLVGEVTAETFVPDKNNLNDGFFSIDDFNRQSEFLEQQDARGDPNDSVASDEEDIDWDADPMIQNPSLSNRKPMIDTDKIEEEDYSSGEEGPTFGNADLNAPSTPSLSDFGAEGPMEETNPSSNTNDIKYADFFAPPPRKATESTRTHTLSKTQPPLREDDIQRTIAAVRRDLLEDELSAEEDSDPDHPSQTKEDPSDPLSHRSNHEKRQAALAQQIRRLEAASVAKRDWTLSGEARATERPINSLLEEDLEFERTGKPVPVITSEVSEDIEALIKRRILAREFDEVIRRRPDSLSLNGASAPRRGRFELDDTKPAQSLAEMYEAEHLRAVDPTGYMSTRDEKLKRQHEDIERLWRDVSAKLDALSSLHYKPKPPEVAISVVADVPVVSMEDARPSGVGVGGLEAGSMLAPQEVYKPGEEKDAIRRGEVIRGGVPVGRVEMSREEKLRRRRREKERMRKAGGVGEKDRQGGKEGRAKKGEGKRKKEKEKDEVVGALKRGGVKVIGKKGEIRGMDGKRIGGRSESKDGGGFKL
ncbi:U3 snoRNP protein [Schaereria dolodes]|nr:U3 snoRNP protein [Schaereria dolodes]